MLDIAVMGGGTLSDLISRQAAIEAMKYNPEKFASAYKHNGLYDEFIEKEAISILQDLPSAHEWIPVTDRLPEIGEHHVSEHCICYCEDGEYAFSKLEENVFGQAWWDCERDDEYHSNPLKVVAWRPLPEPYRGDKE